MLRKVSYLLMIWTALAFGIPASAEPAKDPTLKSMPENYHLYAYDDCGAQGRQPHVEMADCFNAQALFILSNVSVQERSAVFGNKELRFTYDDLDPARSYILALTYVNRNKGALRLEADGIELHPPLTLTKLQSMRRVLVTVPQSITQDGKMRLRLQNLAGLDAVVSIAELWATGEPKKMLRMDDVQGTPDGLSGHVMEMTYQVAAGVTVRLTRAGSRQVLATTTTPAGGAFNFPRTLIESLNPRKDLEVIARRGELEVRKHIPVAEQAYQPVRYRPLAAAVAGLPEHTLSLNGIWRINPAPDQAVREKPLDTAGWGDLRVPGEWALQGYDIPQHNSTTALAREFTVPAEWAGYRIFLRFDAIHGGTRYWLNGKPLGYSENLFTPVEWEITDAARPGQTNRLDLAMLVGTKSEEMSHSCYYTGYTLGGIDRDVRLFALPRLHLATLKVNAGLDRAYRDGELQMELGLDNPATKAQKGLDVAIQLYDAAGKPVAHSTPQRALEPLQPGRNNVSITSQVPNPLKWNAEQPNLYKLVLELHQEGRLIERIEHVGFRTIEAKGRQIYVNGVRVKLAGVCHMEADPLTGRADTKRHAETDVKFFKSANLNYVRTTIHPSTQEFLDAADRLGLYVELETPFTWVTETDDLTDLKALLTPTSAMIDDCHMHPSIIIYSLANESSWGQLFDQANKLCKKLDPTRLTTINSATGVPILPGDAYENCDLVNQHYPKMPFDKVHEGDPRPLLIGECFFEVYHERTDVTINPGMRELWAHGSAEPESPWGKVCDALYSQPCRLRAGIHPGAWSHIYHSDRIIGSEIWSGVDDIAFMKNGKLASSENGNAYWGLIDGWRRPKPELWLSKAVFSPVWFPHRQAAYTPGQEFVRIPVENRYAFTDFKELNFTWALDGATGQVALALAPAATGKLEIPIPPETPAGKKLNLRVTDGKGELINAATITLGTPLPPALSQPRAGAPKFTDNGKTSFIQGNGFALVLDRQKGDFDATSPGHNSPLLSFPALHVTRIDYGDLGFGKAPYAVFPELKTRVIESVTVTKKAAGLEITIKDHYQDFAGSVRWLLDKNGVGKLSYDYAYTGKQPLETREVGLKTLLRPQFDEVRWQRWSEWGDIFPPESISRIAGRAKARRAGSMPDVPANVRPEWPWSQDQTELGTADFRAAKFNIYEAALVAPGGSGIGVSANADVHFRPCLAEDGVKMHLLKQCTLAPVTLKEGDRIKGEFALRLLGGSPAK